MASTTSALRPTGAALGMRCLTGIGLSGNDVQLSSAESWCQVLLWRQWNCMRSSLVIVLWNNRFIRRSRCAPLVPKGLEQGLVQFAGATSGSADAKAREALWAAICFNMFVADWRGVSQI